MKMDKKKIGKIAATVLVAGALVYGVIYADLNIGTAVQVLFDNDAQAKLIECLGAN